MDSADSDWRKERAIPRRQRRFRRSSQWRPLARWTLVASIVIILAIALLKVAQLEPLRGLVGVFQRVVPVTYFGWTFAFAARLRRIAQTLETT
jgi:hypothetical protein